MRHASQQMLVSRPAFAFKAWLRLLRLRATPRSCHSCHIHTHYCHCHCYYTYRHIDVIQRHYIAAAMPLRRFTPSFIRHATPDVSRRATADATPPRYTLLTLEIRYFLPRRAICLRLRYRRHIQYVAGHYAMTFAA